MRRARVAASMALALLACASPAGAQPQSVTGRQSSVATPQSSVVSAAVEPGRIELGVGPQWVGRAGFGSRDANETTGAGNPFTLFSSSTELRAATGIEARFGVRVTRRLEAEVIGSYATPLLVIRTTGDIEKAADVAARERVRQYTIQGAVVWYLPVGRLGARTHPFVTAGVGYLRQLHENDALATDGKVYGVGGGIKHLLVSRDGRRLKGVGVRVDVRAVARASGVALDRGTHVSPAVSASLFVRF